MRRSNFSGVILFNTLRVRGGVSAHIRVNSGATSAQGAAETHPFTLRMSRSCSSDGPTRVQGLAARTIFAPASPGARGVRSAAPSPLLTALRVTERFPDVLPSACRGGGSVAASRGVGELL